MMMTSTSSTAKTAASSGEPQVHEGGRHVMYEPTIAYTPVVSSMRLIGRRRVLTGDGVSELNRKLENLFIGGGTSKKLDAATQATAAGSDISAEFATKRSTLKSLGFDEEKDKNESSDEEQENREKTLDYKTKRAKPATDGGRNGFHRPEMMSAESYLQNFDDQKMGRVTLAVVLPHSRKLAKVTRSSRLSPEK